MSGIRTVSRGIVFKSLSTALGGVLTLTLSVLLTRKFGREAYGWLVMAYTVVNLAPVLTEAGVKGGLRRFLPVALRDADQVRAGALLRAATAVQLAGVAVFTPLMLLGAGPLSGAFFRRPELHTLFLAGAVCALGVALMDYVLSVYQAMERWATEAALSLAYLGLYLGLSLFVIWGLGARLQGVLWANATAAVLTVGAGWALAPQWVRLAWRPSPGLAVTGRELMRFGMPLVVINMNFLLLQWFDKALLGRYSSAENLAAFYIAFLFVNALMVFVKVLVHVLMPYLARLEGASAAELSPRFNRLSKWFLQLSVFAGAAAYFFIDPVIRALYGPAFEPSITMFRWMLPLFIMRTVYQPVGMFTVNVFGETGVSLKLNMITATLVVVCNLILIPRFGVPGALAANTLAYGLSFVVLPFGLPQVCRLLALKGWLREAASAAGVTALCLLAAWQAWPPVVSGVAVLAAYAALLGLTRAWRREDWDLFRQVLSGMRQALAVRGAA